MTHPSPLLSESPVPEIYADGILDIGFGNGMIRIDLFSLSPVHKDENGQPLPAIRQRIVMSLQGFLSSLGTMDGMRRHLEQANVLLPAATAAVDRPAQARPSAPPAVPKSPNFS